MRMKLISGFLLIAGLMVLPCQADTVNDLLKSAEDNYNAQKYAKALEDLDWAKKEITNKHLKVIEALLPNEIPGYQAMDVDGGAALGMQNVSREYTKDDNRIKISIMSMNNSQGGGLGAFMGMAAAFGAMEAGSQSEMIVVKGHKGQFNLEKSSNNGTLTFTLTKAVIQIETWGFTDSAAAKMAAEKLDFDAIEQAFM